jgi:hypothetical protein
MVKMIYAFKMNIIPENTQIEMMEMMGKRRNWLSDIFI